MQDPAQYLNPSVGVNTIQDIIDIIHFKTGVARIKPAVRLLHDDLNPFYLPQPVDENDPTNISKFVEAAKVTQNTSQDVHRDCDLTMREIPGIDQLNTLKDLVKIYVQWIGYDKEVLLDVPIGIFNLAIPDRTLSSGTQVWSVKGYDMTWRISHLWFLDSYMIPAGTLVTDAIQTILMMDELPPSQGGRVPAIPGVWPDPNNPALSPAGCDMVGPNIPANRIQIAPSTIEIETPLMLTRRMNVLGAINDLLTAINYWKLWVDEHGVFRSSPIPYETGFIPTPTWSYTTDDTSIIKADVTQRIADQTGIANVVNVVSEPNNGPPIVARQYNNNLNSQISIPNMGYPIVKMVKDDKIRQQSIADLRALIELNFAALGSEAVEWITHLNPFHQAHDYIALNVINKQGVIEIESETYPFVESTWDMDLQTQEQHHVAGRVVPL